MMNRNDEYVRMFSACMLLIAGQVPRGVVQLLHCFSQLNASVLLRCSLHRRRT